MEPIIIVAIISLIGNLYQLISSKRGRDLDAIKKELELLQELQNTKDTSFKEALKRKDVEIDQLKAQIKEQRESIERNVLEVKRMSKLITSLIANGCRDAKHCPTHSPYSIENLDKMITGMNIITDAE